MCYVQNDHFLAENIQRNTQLINFNIFLGLFMTFICFTNDKKRSHYQERASALDFKDAAAPSFGHSDVVFVSFQ